MHTLEYEIIQNLNIFELKKSLEVYLDLFDNLTLENQDFKPTGDNIRSMKNFLIYLNSILYINYYEKNNSKDSYYLKRISIVDKIEKSNKLSELRSLGLEILEFHFEFNNKIKNKNQHYIVNKAIKYMKENLNEDLNLDKVASQIHISSNYLSFLFSKNLNYSFSEYLNMLKIEKANFS